MKKMLMVYPNNFLQGAMGTNNRVRQLVEIFNELDIEVDQFGYENWSPDSSFKDFDQQNQKGLIKNLILYDFKKGYMNEKKDKDSKIHIFSERVKKKFKESSQKEYLQNWVPAGADRLFRDTLQKKSYDIIVLFYTYFGKLLEDLDYPAQKVYFMEDSMFIQQYTWDKDNVDGISIGKLLDEELLRLRNFDEIFCISNDEKIFYEKVTGKYIHFMPHLLPEGIQQVKKPFRDRKWDVFFIGFNNPFNVEGLNWFLNEVYPFLNKNLKILLVGSATKQIDVKYSNVDIIPFAPDLDEIYEDIKVTICPMFRGTGMKIKVVEAMSKGGPIVCNERGVDGFQDKTMCGCCVTQDKYVFADYINKLCSDENYYNCEAEKVRKYYTSTFDREKYKGIIDSVLCKKSNREYD